MNNLRTTPEGVLYLDVDGVIISDEPPFDDAREVFLDGKASDYVCRRLGTCGLSLVWLTTWEDSILDMTEEYLTDLRGGRVIKRADPLDHRKGIAWKTEALVQEQLECPRPFVWVDDQIDDDIEQKVLE